MKKIIALIIASTIVSGCTDSNTARDALTDAGYTNVRTTGYDFFGCAEDDAYHTGFVATSPSGFTVKGVVCSGFLKGTVIRTFGRV